MILGIDHLSLSVDNTEQARLQYENAGFKCTFVEYNIPSHPSKMKLLDQYQATHDIGVFKPADQGIAIEITNHGTFADNDAPFYYHKNEIEYLTTDIQAEKAFFTNVFRFQEANENRLEFISPVPSWRGKLYFKENKKIKPATLDGRGHTCLAFLTNNLSQDVKIAETNGAWDIIDPFRLLVNGRYIDIVMFRTPNGAICELIQINA